MTAHITDLEGQRSSYNMTSSVWRMFANSSTESQQLPPI